MAAHKIVIADSNANWNSLLEKLEVTGIKAQHATSGHEVVRSVNKGRVDVLVVDTHLSDMSGLSLVSIVRELQPDIKLIMTTRENTPNLESECREQGLVYYAVHPVRSDILFDTILRAVNTLHAPHAVR